MKKVLILASLAFLIFSCKKSASVSKSDLEGFVAFGDTISPKNTITPEQMIKKYEALKEGDTVEVKFASKINSVCKKKGCWMNMALSNDKETFVKFKDYAFFVPKNADGSQAIVSGKAFLSIETIDEQKHYATDAGESKENIDKITTPKATYSFLANGVLIKK
ncbi:MAG: DUF4920 domain-containing protein [Bacteroidota bacterium]